MPKKPIDYSTNIIYNLVHNEDYDNANIYIGSTTDFVKRKYSHERSCHNEKDKGYSDKKYQYIRENGGWNGFDMIEIEKYPCNDDNESRAREEYWRSHFNAQLNAIRAYRTEERDKEHRKECYGKNKSNILEEKKEYYKAHKNKSREYYEKNKGKKLEYQNEYYGKNKENITCECGCIITKSVLARHKKSQKHLLLTIQIKYEFVDDNEKN